MGPAPDSAPGASVPVQRRPPVPQLPALVRCSLPLRYVVSRVLPSPALPELGGGQIRAPRGTARATAGVPCPSRLFTGSGNHGRSETAAPPPPCGARPYGRACPVGYSALSRGAYRKGRGALPSSAKFQGNVPADLARSERYQPASSRFHLPFLLRALAPGCAPARPSLSPFARSGHREPPVIVTRVLLP